MTPEERQMLAGLFERVNASGAGPRDAQAEALINDAVRAAPFAPYVLSQTVLVQQHALEAAAHRIAELEAAMHEAGPQQQEQGSFLGNLGRSIFGSGAPSASPRPGYDPDAYQRGPAPPQQSYAPPPPQQYASPVPGRGAAAFRRRAAGEDSSRTPRRLQPALRAASRSATFSAACSAAIRAAACLAAAASAGRDSPAAASRPRRSTTSTRVARAAPTSSSRARLTMPAISTIRHSTTGRAGAASTTCEPRR